MARTARADVGPLAPYANGYRELLAARGYTPHGVVRKLWELGRLSGWMIVNGLGPEGLTTERFGEFSDLCAAGIERPVGHRTRSHWWFTCATWGWSPTRRWGRAPPMS